MTDLFALRRTDYRSAAHRQTFVLTNVSTLVAFGPGAAIGCGICLGKVSLSGVPTIELLVSTVLLYWLLERIRVQRRRDRLWRA